MLIKLIWQLSVIKLFFEKYLQSPSVRIGFVEVEINTSNIWSFVNVYTYAMSSNRPIRSWDFAVPPILWPKYILWFFQAKRSS